MGDTNERIEELEQLVRYHADLYFNKSAPEITDAEFDALVDELKVLSPDSAALQEVGAVPSYGRKLKHDRMMGSLDKVKTVDEVRKWAGQYPSLTESLDNGTLIGITPKMDGVACRLNYEQGRLVQAATRGNGEVGQDVTDNIRAMRSIPNQIVTGFTGEVRGEVYMPKSVFERINEALRAKREKPFKNPRNAASGSVTCQDPQVTASRGLQFRSYDVFADEAEFATEQEKRAWMVDNLPGIEPVELTIVPFDEFETYAVEWAEKRPALDFEIDGLVVALNDIATQEAAGWNGRCPRGKVAYKFKPEQRTAVVRGVDWQVGRTGRLTPVCRIEPTYISGSTVSNLTLHNYARVKELDIGDGDEILFEKAGEIIPQVIRVMKRNSETAAWVDANVQGCPSCGGVIKLDENEVNLWCPNPACPAKLDRRILHWLKTLEVLGVGPETVIGLCEAGYIKDIPDLYFLSHADVKQVTGGERKAQNVIEAILGKNEIPLWQFICALGIENVGPATAKALAKNFKTLSCISSATISELTKTDGVGETVGEAILEGLGKLSDTIDHLKDAIDIVDVQEATGPLAGKTFCVTGSLPSGKKRNELVKEIEAAGGEFKSSVGKGLNFLVIADPNSNSSKAQKARKLGTECISEEQLVEMMRG